MKIAKIAGITFKINIFLLVLMGLYAYLGWGKEIVLVFSAVFLHEIAHTITGWFLGVKVRSVELFPFGGQAQVQDFMALLPEKEIYLAAAGPVFSLTLAGIFHYTTLSVHPLGELFINVNLTLGLFNCLPVLPLDGGRMVRAFLSSRIGYRRATHYTAQAGKFVAVVLLLGAVFFYIYLQQINTNLIFIGIFLYWAAYREGKFLAYAFMRFLVHKKAELAQKGFLPARQIVGQSNTFIPTILNSLGPNYYTVVVEVDENHQIVGMHSEAVLIEVLMEKGPRTTLGDC